jgi:hypothetical protein
MDFPVRALNTSEYFSALMGQNSRVWDILLRDLVIHVALELIASVWVVKLPITLLDECSDLAGLTSVGNCSSSLGCLPSNKSILFLIR